MFVKNRSCVAMWLPRLSAPPGCQVPIPFASEVRTYPKVPPVLSRKPVILTVPATSSLSRGEELPIPMLPAESIVSLLNPAVLSNIENLPTPMAGVPTDIKDQSLPEATVLSSRRYESPAASTSMF